MVVSIDKPLKEIEGRLEILEQHLKANTGNLVNRTIEANKRFKALEQLLDDMNGRIGKNSEGCRKDMSKYKELENRFNEWMTITTNRYEELEQRIVNNENRIENHYNFLYHLKGNQQKLESVMRDLISYTANFHRQDPIMFSFVGNYDKLLERVGSEDPKLLKPMVKKNPQKLSIIKLKEELDAMDEDEKEPPEIEDWDDILQESAYEKGYKDAVKKFLPDIEALIEHDEDGWSDTENWRTEIYKLLEKWRETYKLLGGELK